jgi:hypothetical protein
MLTRQRLAWICRKVWLWGSMQKRQAVQALWLPLTAAMMLAAGRLWGKRKQDQFLQVMLSWKSLQRA